MPETEEFKPGGFRYAPGVFQYSAGVAALPGYAIRRVRFRQPVALTEGFRRIKATLEEAGRPTLAFCACELRSPKPFTEGGFAEFNRHYVGTLAEWGLFDGTKNPVARSNVCPEIDPPSEPSFHAFSFTVPAANETSFVISGSAEASEGASSYESKTVRLGETTPDAMREKAQFVLSEMERRMQHLGFAWSDTTDTQVYTIHDLFPFFGDEIVRRGAARNGLTWHFNRPPVQKLEFEMDCRRVSQERVII
jgi:hypothetical protein